MAGKLLIKPFSILVTLSLVGFLAACKIQIAVPEGGNVVTRSGAILCFAGETCEIDVVDQFFEETFIAEPHDGYVFKHWAKRPRSLCGEAVGHCALATTNFNDNPNLLAVLESDTAFLLAPVFEPAPRLTEEDIRAEGRITPTEDGFEMLGTLAIKFGDAAERAFTKAGLD